MINIFELNKKRDLREIRKQECFTEILKKCHSKIQASSEKGQTQCIYTVPYAVLGLPIYRIEKCIGFIMNKLQSNGFIVNYTSPNHLYISWEHIPSSIKNPSVKSIEVEMMANPYKNYSYLATKFNTFQNQKQIGYYQ